MHPPLRIRPTPPRPLAGFCLGTCMAGVLGVACIAQDGTSSATGTGGGYHPERNTGITAVNRRPDPNRLQEINTRRVQTERFDAANTERKRQLIEDTARLLRLAAELNVDPEKTGGTDVPLTAAARAEMIEKLARSIKDKMKLTIASP